MKSKVAIIMGSKSDLKVMNEAAAVLKDFDVLFEVQIVSAHRTPEFMQKFALSADAKGYKLIIAGAGGAAHLPGMVASLTTLPVIGVPIGVGELKGLDSLLSIAQMPRGVPVATMSVNGAHNAGLMAVRMLAMLDRKLTVKLMRFQRRQSRAVKLSNQELKKKRTT